MEDRILAKFVVNVIIKKQKAPSMPVWMEELLKRYTIVDSDNRIVLSMPVDWVGLTDGTVHDIINQFGSAAYISLAYITNGDEIVVDCSGERVDTFKMVEGSIIMQRYVKRDLRIIKILNKEREVFIVKDYILDLSKFDSIVKVLDLYCVGMESGIRVADFLAGGRLCQKMS